MAICGVLRPRKTTAKKPETTLPTLHDLIADHGVHVFDGAMGTMLYGKGFFLNVCYDELCVKHPELVLERDLRAAVRRTLATLPPAQQEVVRLRHVEGLRFREIAERLGRPLGTVLTQMRAALERMAAALEEYR